MRLKFLLDWGRLLWNGNCMVYSENGEGSCKCFLYCIILVIVLLFIEMFVSVGLLFDLCEECLLFEWCFFLLIVDFGFLWICFMFLFRILEIIILFGKFLICRFFFLLDEVLLFCCGDGDFLDERR